MKSRDELAASALAIAQPLAEAALGASVVLTAQGGGNDWHGTLHRRIHEERLTMWKPLAWLDVVVDGAGMVVGYVDHDAYRRADDATTLTDDEVRALVSDEEVLPPHARIVAGETYPGPEGGRLIAVTVTGDVNRVTRSWSVEINAARRLVAAVRPLDSAAAS